MFAKMLNQRTIRNSTVVPADPRKRTSTGRRSAACVAALMLVSIPAIALAQSPCPGIHVTILNIKNSTGTVACALFESSAGFPIEVLHSATNVMVIKIRKTQARCDFEDIPPGTYAIAVIHDENMNGKLDTNVFGIPTEGYGFSKDARALIGYPRFLLRAFHMTDGPSIYDQAALLSVVIGTPRISCANAA